MSFLDKNGLERFLGKIRENFATYGVINTLYDDFDTFAQEVATKVLETEGKVTALEEKVPVDKLLRNLGHYSDEGSLPSDGQESGTEGSYPRTFSTDPTISEVTIPTNTLYPYVFGVISSSTYYLYVATEYPETIKSLAYGSDGSYEIYFEASTEKPVAVYYQRGTGISGAYCIPDSQKDDYYVVRNNQPDNGTEITEPCTLTGYLGGYGQAKIFGNLPNKVKYKSHGYYAYARNSSGYGNTYTQISDATSDSLTLAFKDNFTYNEGMNMLKFDDSYQAYWLTNESEVETNDLATVGEYNDLYVVNSNGKWEKWSQPNEEEIINSTIASINDQNLYSTKEDYENYTLDVNFQLSDMQLQIDDLKEQLKSTIDGDEVSY